jgi:hypothetical protein
MVITCPSGAQCDAPTVILSYKASDCDVPTEPFHLRSQFPSAVEHPRPAFLLRQYSFFDGVFPTGNVFATGRVLNPSLARLSTPAVAYLSTAFVIFPTGRVLATDDPAFL